MTRGRVLLLSLGLTVCAADAMAPEILGLEKDEHYFDEHFVELVPPIRLPTNREGTLHTRVMIRLPDGESITTVQRGDGLPRLSFPPGSVLERVDEWTGAEGARIVDVRGTRIDADGRAHFHDYRRSPSAGRLVGFEWPADHHDALAPEVAKAMAAKARVSEASIANKLGCPSCHASDLPELAVDRPGRLVRRGTDLSGFVVPATVLVDEAPLERYFFDPNAEDRFISVRCPTGAVSWIDGLARCASGAPRARYDLRGAWLAGDPRAEAVCRSRRYLYERLDAPGQRAFARSLTPCGH